MLYGYSFKCQVLLQWSSASVDSPSSPRSSCDVGSLLSFSSCVGCDFRASKLPVCSCLALLPLDLWQGGSSQVGTAHLRMTRKHRDHTWSQGSNTLIKDMASGLHFFALGLTSYYFSTAHFGGQPNSKLQWKTRPRNPSSPNTTWHRKGRTWSWSVICDSKNHAFSMSEWYPGVLDGAQMPCSTKILSDEQSCEHVLDTK